MPASSSEPPPSTAPSSGASSTDESYRRYTRRVLDEVGEQGLAEAMALAIGTTSIEEFHRSGQMELDLLVQSGLRPEHYLVDVGCGSGRLTSKLAAGHTGPYLGTELLPELLDYARQAAPFPSWRFEVVDGLRIPEQDGVADMVCFFSVITHLRHEQSYLYLEEARRVLKPGGRVVLTFLEFSQASHLVVFDSTVDALRRGDDMPVNQFVSSDALEVWAGKLGMEVEAIHPGGQPYIQLSDSPHHQSGETRGSLGQSACVLVKPFGPTAG